MADTPIVVDQNSNLRQTLRGTKFRIFVLLSGNEFDTPRGAQHPRLGTPGVERILSTGVSECILLRIITKEYKWPRSGYPYSLLSREVSVLREGRKEAG